MTATATNTTPTTTLLTLLHQYSTLHSTASTNFKSTLWNITKARRGRGYQTSGGPLGSSDYSVENVREELDATALIEVVVRLSDGVEPDLVDEHDDGNNAVNNKLKGNYSSLDMNTMVLHFDGVEGIKRKSVKAAANINATTSATTIEESSNNNQEGLRRRKNKGNNNNDESNTTWTEEQTPVESQKALSDPLQLFGVPPPALRVAQSHSRDALAYYVEVANLARQIMTIVQEEEGE
mmetsp:Transcript_18410/g.31157  ORF Transcript_18410/g.31157 Transcript_18410/m.31157 type:complete len:237 (-) Transcript_18410:101-811(-)